MKIYIVGSMQYAHKMAEISDELRKRGHEPIMSKYLDDYLGEKTDEEREKIKIAHYKNPEAIREFWQPMRDGADAILVLNYDRHGIKNYIGGSVFLEMGFAHVLNLKIFVMNPVPDMPFYGTELASLKPIVIHEDLDKIK